MAVEVARPSQDVEGTKDVVDMLEEMSGSQAEKQASDEGGVQEHVVRTPEDARVERRLLLKADLIILPLIFVSYLLDFLDRSDVGNAAVAGMTTDLHMSASQLSTAASMFYVTYVLFQLPGNLAVRVIDPQVLLGIGLMVWGLFNTFSAAGAVNGLIAYAIEKDLDGTDGLASWRWYVSFRILTICRSAGLTASARLFIVEGVICIGWGFVILLLLPPAPEKARWYFTAPEKELAIRRTREAFNEPHSKIRWADLAKIFRDWNFYPFSIVFACSNISLASFSTFLPVILRTLGYSKLDSQLLTIPVYVVAAVSTLAMAYFSDRLRRRGYFMIGAFAWLIAGWLILRVSKNHRLSFAGTFLIGAGTYPSVVLTFSWVLNNYAGFTRRAGTYAIVCMIAQCFSIAGTEIYSDPPFYCRGNGFALGSAVVGLSACVVLVFRLKRANRKKREAADSDVARQMRLCSIEELGNDHPDFYHFI
ncbi:hypothetical protein PRZ48_007321 [Zasmidium cellare]|uniref:Uncharacterized protein n=1 Tax=Zasmidium cellare TaxID=395010 RepID=A0ABR0EJ11_ZASCE|nr:hypothetical protein PRZ48_007321 [Zasmidium cellare]